MSDEKKEWTFPEKTPEELRQIAADIYENKIFSDGHVKKEHLPDMMPSIFLPILLGAFKGAPESYMDEVGMIYEYMSEAGPRSINGYPSFFSFRVLNQAQTDAVNEAYLEYKKFKEGFVATGASGTEL